MIRFKFLTGDVNWLDYGGKWISQKFNNGEFDYWLVRSIENWAEHDSEMAARCKYLVEIKLVAPEQFRDKKAAMDCSGIEEKWDDLIDEVKVEIIESYSGGVTIFSESGNNYKDLFKRAQKEAEVSSMLFGFKMDAPVNKIGSTGWDALKGDISAGLRRYSESDSPEKQIMRKLHGMPTTLQEAQQYVKDHPESEEES